MRYISLFVLGLVAWVCADAQAIQLLPSDPAVISGALPNGMAYYIASNPALKGTADFALVQRTGGETIPDADRRQIVSLSQNCLTSQYRMPDLAVQDYFIRAGVVPGKEGFVQVTDNATVFRFPGVLLSRTETALDSTLLVLVGMAEKAGHCSDPTTSGWYSPADHAVVVAGDVDAAAVVEKLKMLSYIIPASLSLPRDGYEWTDREIGRAHV